MLQLRFSVRVGRVEVACDGASVRLLQSLRTRFASATTISSQAFDVELDDLLVNLYELASWPDSDPDVRWEPALLALVEGNTTDAMVAADRLAGRREEETELAVVPMGWSAPLTDFQRRDLGKLLELTHGANFSVPGAGKTRVALAVFQARRAADEISRMLVVCPKSAFESWREEAALCYPDGGLRVAILDSAIPPQADVLLVNYERLPDLRSVLLTWLRAQPAILVLDEAHRMKRGPAGAWGTVCMALAPHAARRLVLTGTPAPNGRRDLENILAFVWPGQGRRSVVNAMAGNDLRTASQQLRPLFVRTTKGELGLPPINLSLRRIQLPPLHRELYQALLGQASAKWRGGDRSIEALGKTVLYLLMAATTPALLAVGASRHDPLPYRLPPLEPRPDTTFADLLRDLPHYELSPKYQEVVSIVASNAALGRKTLVWSTFVRNLTSLERLLRRFRPALIHGGTVDRTEQLRRFRQDSACAVLLSNPATMGEGVSLHHVCHDAIYVDRDFAAGRFLQSLDRIHRLGLSADAVTTVTVLAAEETIDEIVEQRLGQKLRFMGGILDDPAVLELGDLDEEPTESVGMDAGDVAALVGYLSGYTT